VSRKRLNGQQKKKKNNNQTKRMEVRLTGFWGSSYLPQNEGKNDGVWDPSSNKKMLPREKLTQRKWTVSLQGGLFAGKYILLREPSKGPGEGGNWKPDLPVKTHIAETTLTRQRYLRTREFRGKRRSSTTKNVRIIHEVQCPSREGNGKPAGQRGRSVLEKQRRPLPFTRLWEGKRYAPR